MQTDITRGINSIVSFQDIGIGVNTAPFDDEYLDMEDARGREFVILDVVPFTNAKGEGVHIRVAENYDTEDERTFRLCTHAVAIVKKLTSEAFTNALREGNLVKVAVTKRASKTTGKMMTDLV